MEKVKKLVETLEQATLMAKQLPSTTTTDPSLTLQIYSTLHAAHFHLSTFLSHSALPPPQPSPLLPDHDNATSPMAIGSEEDQLEAEQNSVTAPTVDGVLEERMKDFFIQNKRLKRSLSPSVAVVGERRGEDVDEGGDQVVREHYDDRAEDQCDPNGKRLRALELVYQFHS